MFIRLSPLFIFLFPLSLLSDDLPVEVPRPTSETYRHMQVNPYIALPEGITQYRKLTVSPQTLPDPLLRYQLNVFSIEKEVGNAYPLYVAALKEFSKWEQSLLGQCYQSEEYRKLDPGNEDDWKTMNQLRFKAFPVYQIWGSDTYIEITAEEEAQLYARLDGVYKLMEKASRKTYYDWSDAYEWNGIMTMLEPLQESRTLIRYLASKANWEIRTGNYHEAIKTVQVGLALADFMHEGTPPSFIVGSLVGIALKGAMLEQLFLLSAQPDAPNLYPALMQIAFSTKPMRDALRSELLFLMSARFTSADFLESMDRLTPEQAKAVFEEIMSPIVMHNASYKEGPEHASQRSVTLSIYSLGAYMPAKKRLLQNGFTEQEIEAMTTYQVIAPFFVEKLRQAYDLILVDAMMPYGESHTAINAEEFFNRVTRPFANAEGSSIDLILALLAPAVQNYQSTYFRQAQTTDMLKIVEALRYYASVHGKLPSSLSEITELAVPKTCPITGKPYEYRIEGKTAVIEYEQGYIRGKNRIDVVVE